MSSSYFLPRLFSGSVAVSLGSVLVVGSAGLCRAQAGQGSGATLAQQASAAVLPQTHAGADEVSISISAYNSRHKPVLGLKPDDLTVTDNGTPVKLKQLRLVRGAGEGGHLITLLFDAFPRGLAKEARESAEHVLSEFPEKGFAFSVLDLGGRLRVLQGFTDDRALVQEAINAETEAHAPAAAVMPGKTLLSSQDPAEKQCAEYVQAREKDLRQTAREGVNASGDKVDGTTKERAEMLVAALQNAQRNAQEEGLNPRLAGLQAAAEAQQRAPERKALIYFTISRQMDATVLKQAQAVAASAARAGVTIYVVDLDPAQDAGFAGRSEEHKKRTPRKEAVDLPSCPACSDFGPPQSNAAERPSQLRGGVADDHSRPMAALAEESGGLYIDVESGFKKNVGQMIKDLTTYYRATYTPPVYERDGSYHSITIEPRLKNVHIHSEAGYHAVGGAGEAALRPFEARLLKVLESGAPSSDVPFQATVQAAAAEGQDGASALVVRVPVRMLDVKRDEETHLYAAHASIFARLRDSHGAEIEHTGEDMDTLGDLTMADADMLTMQRHIAAAPGRYTLEVAVVDQLSGKVGVQRSTVELAEAPEDAGALVSAAKLETVAATQLIEGARERAVWYREGLPNFICNEITRRSETAGKSGRWKLRDTMVEELVYRDNHETRTTLELNGVRNSGDHARLFGVRSAGEFGTVLKAIFGKEAEAEFVWNSTEVLGNRTVQVFDYAVEQKHSLFRLEAPDGSEIVPGFHGQVSIDSATRSVRRLSLIADGVPASFPINGARLDVVYDYVTLNGHEYLVPVSAETRVIQGKKLVLNAMQFRNYRRFGSNMRIVDFKQVAE